MASGQDTAETTIQKLFRVISLVHDAYVPTPPPPPNQPSEPTRPRPSPHRQTIDLSLTPPNYAAIVRLLGSAIVDLTSAPIQLSPAHPAAISWPDVCHDEPAMAPDSPLPISGPSNSSPQPASPPTTSPSLIGIGDKEVKSLPNASNTFLNLPGEVHARIFREARKFSTDPKAWPAITESPDTTVVLVENESWPDDQQDQHTSVYRPLLQPWPAWIDDSTGSNSGTATNETHKVGGRLHAQEFSHSMALVASSLVPVARTVGFERIYVRSRKQVEHLVKLWSGEIDYQEPKTERKVEKRSGKGDGLWVERLEDGGVHKFWAEEPWCENLNQDVKVNEVIKKNDDGQALIDKGKQKAKEEVDSTGSGVSKTVEDQSTCTETTSVERLTSRCPTNLGQYVLHVEIQVPTVGPEQTKDQDRHSHHHHHHHHRHHSGLRHTPAFLNTLTELQNLRDQLLEKERDQLVRLIRLMPNLKSLAICLFRHQYSLLALGLESGLSQIGYGLDGLEGELLNSICSLKSLTTLILREGIDFSELVVILQSIPGLEDLRFQGGIECADGSTDLDEEIISSPHFCKFKTFVLHTPASSVEIAHISPTQLDWILTPSVGTIKELDLAFWANSIEENQVWGIEGPENVIARWATNTFADLIVRLGSTLINLIIRGCAYVGSTDPSLHIEPHNGFLDYALSRCVKLEYLAIDFSITGPNLLSSISLTSSLTTTTTTTTTNNNNSSSSSTSKTPHQLSSRLKSFTGFGKPRHTSAKMLREILQKPEQDQTFNNMFFPLLKSITLVDFPTHRVNLIDWPCNEVRKLQSVCRDRKIWFGVTS